MTQTRDSSDDLEKRLEQLERQVDNLEIALDEWRQWKQEYEALHTDVQALSPSATRPALAETRQSYKGELVNEKELVDIFGRDDSRKRDQIVSTITNRISYVSQNISTLEKQLEAAENKLAATRVVSFPEANDDDGLAITEISEELDEDDNVISYSLRRPGDSQSELLGALEKAGIKEVPAGSSEAAAKIPSKSSQSTSGVLTAKSPASEPRPQPNEENAADGSEASPVPKKKSVKFAEDTKPATENKPTSNLKTLTELYREAKEQESLISDPVMPADESPEDAQLREDMILYNKETMLYEMAPIVAELQLEEGSGDDDDWDYDDSEEDEDDDEDQWGRSTSGVVDDEYRRQMLELKERLSRQTFGNPQTDGDDEDDDGLSEGIGRITIKGGDSGSGQNQPTLTMTNAGGALTDLESQDEAKKSVRFAPSLDIAESSSAAQPEPAAQPEQPEVDPLSDIVERTSAETSRPTPTSGRKVSKFRKERASGGPTTQTPPIAPEKPTGNQRYAPAGPEGQTLATEILEKEPTDEVKEPDELDADLMHQQVTEEFFKMRNRMIGRQGGFLKEDTNPIQPLSEEEGGPKRLSRFKAARLAQS
ncbi:Prefoldin subunit-domain-containing protein [Astrocystis sublimbata]|nr:Prefoldin subunit-domain-containing protein [Astrocystis sublimbata]